MGLHEHTTDGKSFDLTLFRAVGNLGKSGAGPHIQTPEAQMQGNLQLRIAFSWKGYGKTSNALWKKSVRLLQPAWAAILHPDFESRKYAESYFRLESDTLLISAFFYDAVIGKNVIRMFNPTANAGSGKLSGLNVPATLVKLRYERGTVAETAETVPSDKIELRAGEIATFSLN